MKTFNRFFSQDTTFAYLCILPTLIALAVFMFYPVGHVFVMSFFKTNIVGELVHFVGVDNYEKIFSSKRFIRVIVRTIWWTTLAVFIKLVLGLMIGLILNWQFSGRKLVRAMVVLPWATSIPIATMMWKWTFDGELGLLNYTLSSLGIWSEPPYWLANAWSAFTATLTVDIWLGLPFLGLVYLAGLQAIPSVLYEAAIIDGANRWQQFIHVTLPSLAKVIMIATLLSFFWTFNDFNVIYILTNGGPAQSTEILVTNLYRTGFQYFKWDQASAMAIVTFLILALASVFYAYFYKKVED